MSCGTFTVTWSCAVLMSITDYQAHKILFTLWDFLENASPFLCALVLHKKNLHGDHFLQRLPCLYRKHHILISSATVSILWVLWHLPYFILPGTMQEGQNFISYAVIGLLTGFLLTAIYLLTKSVLRMSISGLDSLCWLFLYCTLQPTVFNRRLSLFS